MSKRHHVIAFVLLSSSAVFASPAETDDDGFPLVGNMHGKRAAKPRGSRETRLAAAQQASAAAARAELATFVEARFQTLRDGDGYPLVGNMHGKSSDEEVVVAPADELVIASDHSACEAAIHLALASR